MREEIVLPRQLKNDNIRFCKAELTVKKILTTGWNSRDKVLKYDSSELQQHLKEGNNYAIVMGYGHYYGLDFDSERDYELLKDVLPKTFMVLSGKKKLPHLYFRDTSIAEDQLESFKVKEDDKHTLIDIQGYKTALFGPGSWFEEGKVYTVGNDLDITEFSYNEMKAIMMTSFPKEYLPNKWFDDDSFVFSDVVDPIKTEIKSKMTISRALDEMGMNIHKNPTMCPLGHDSVGQACLSFNDRLGLWKCFHCGKGGDIFSLYMLKDNLSFNNSKIALAEKCGIDINGEDVIDEKTVTDKVRDLLSKAHGRKAAIINMSNYLLSTQRIYTLMNDNTEEMWMYSDGIYVPDAKCRLYIILKRIMGTYYSEKIAEEVIDYFKPDTYISQTEFFDSQEKTPINMICVRNGILNIFTRELIPFSPEFFFFYKLNAEYNPDADCVLIKKFFSEILNKDSYEEDLKLMHEMFGYLLLRNYKHHKAFMWFGVGRNGKSLTASLIEELYGRENCSNLSLKVIEDTSSFMLVGMHNKVANIVTDMGSGYIRSTENFRKLTSGDPIECDRKHKTSLTFHSFAKMIILMNRPPQISDSTDAFFDRLSYLEFPYQFKSTQDIEAMKRNNEVIPDNMRVADKELGERLKQPTEMSGLLNWSLDGLNSLESNKGFTENRSTKQKREFWDNASNSLSNFLANFVFENFGEYIYKEEMTQRYTEYCKKFNVCPQNEKQIFNAIERKFANTVKTTRRNGKNVWLNISFIENKSDIKNTNSIELLPHGMI